MGQNTDTYKTIAATPCTEVLFKDRKSKFHGHAFAVRDEHEVKPIVQKLRKRYPTAGHFCFAWQLGVGKQKYRANDDGEPKNSAGMPIYGQIMSFGVTNVLIVVVRIFGGAKLGVPGLINAYRTTAQMALRAARVEERIIETRFELHFGYALMNEVMKILKKFRARVVSQQMENTCTMVIAIPKSKTADLQLELKKIHLLETTQL